MLDESENRIAPASAAGLRERGAKELRRLCKKQGLGVFLISNRP